MTEPLKLYCPDCCITCEMLDNVYTCPNCSRIVNAANDICPDDIRQAATELRNTIKSYLNNPEPWPDMAEVDKLIELINDVLELLHPPAYFLEPGDRQPPPRYFTPPELSIFWSYDEVYEDL